MFGADGAALAYVVGSVVQLVLSLKIAKNYSLAMQFKNYVLLSLVLLTIGGVMWLFNLQFVISTILILCGSFILYIKLHLLTDLELHYYLRRLSNSNRLKSYIQLYLGSCRQN